MLLSNSGDSQNPDEQILAMLPLEIPERCAESSVLFATAPSLFFVCLFGLFFFLVFQMLLHAYLSEI